MNSGGLKANNILGGWKKNRLVVYITADVAHGFTSAFLSQLSGINRQ